MLSRLRSHEHGFTLIEVMVAALVLVAGLLGVVSLLDTANATDASTKAREQGVNLARELIESGRSIPYAQLTPDVSTRVQTMPNLASINPKGSPLGWQIQRRGVTYTVAMGSCAVDDPADGYGPEDPTLFCASTTGQPSTPCPQLLSTGQINGNANVINQISGTLTGQVSIGLCGIDLNLTGRISDLTQADVALCVASACQNQPTTGDQTPDDYKRIYALVTWKTGSGNGRYALVSTIVNNPGLASGPLVRSIGFQPQVPLLTPLFTDTFLGLTIPFSATADSTATSVQWSVNGVPQGSAANVAGNWTWTWSIGLTGSGSEVLDGNYSIGAIAFDTNGNAGPPVSMTVTLNRRKAYAPKNFVGGHNGSLVDFQWAPNREGDITGYQVYRAPGLLQTDVLVCATANVRATSCQDTNPPNLGSINYYVLALDKAPDGTTRQGDHSATLTVTNTNVAPNPPTNLLASTSNGNTVLAWTKPSPSDTDGDPIDFYRIYRDGQAVANRYDTAPGIQTSYTDTATGGVAHTYWVTAVDPQLAESTAAGPVTR
jgi:prepilin-type N-terminal cleavage/methylation domain-containing protein